MKVLRLQQLNAKNAIAANICGIINHPTGTGKTLIQASSIADIIFQNHHKFCISIVLAPRIILADQLQKDVFQIMMDQDENSVEPMMLKVHSGRAINVYDEEQFESFTQGNGGTSVNQIKEEILRAKRLDIPLIIVATYHSSQRWIDALKSKELKMKAEIVCCDEGHYLVQSQFNMIIQQLAEFKIVKKYFSFTATLRETHGEGGLGMNNESIFGKIVHQYKPIEAILDGEITRPRMHFIKVENQAEDKTLGDGNSNLWPTDVRAVIDGFNEHRACVPNIGVKLLVITRGTKHLNYLLSSDDFIQMVKTNKRLTVFDITSAYGAKINGIKVERDFFLKELKRIGNDPLQEAIIFHYDILAEGIDVPGLTGILPFRELGKAKFLQSLGRPARLNNDDRHALYTNLISAKDFKSSQWVKPYCWVIVPYYGELGNDLGASIKGYVTELRDYGFNPAEDVVTTEAGGKKVPIPITVVNPSKDKKGANIIEFMNNLVHEIESEIDACKLKARLAELVTYDPSNHEKFFKEVCIF